MSAAPNESSALSVAIASDASAPATGSNRLAVRSSAINSSGVWPPSPYAIDMEHASASPESMSVAIRTQLSDLKAEMVRLGGLCDNPLIAALVRDRIAFLEATLRSLRGWSSLYTDALHSIFQFASLKELAQLMSVSRRWGAAVTTMPPIAVPAAIRAPVAAVLTSRLCRHIDHLLGKDGKPFSLAAEALLTASARASCLGELKVNLSDTEEEESASLALPRFRELRYLDLALPTKRNSVECNRIIEAIGSLHPQTMMELTLHLPGLPQCAQLSFAPLAALTRLRTFSLKFADTETPLTAAQIDELRALTWLAQLNVPYDVEGRAEFLVRLLQPGHSFSWNTFGAVHLLVTDALGPLLGSLRKLTQLDATLWGLDPSFFASLSQLTELRLNNHHPQMDMDQLAQSLALCTRLTRLSLITFNFRSRHLETLLAALLRLTSLTLWDMPVLESLRCLSNPGLAASLTSLQILILPICPATEVSHLFGLRSLQSLNIDRLQSPLTGAHMSEFYVSSRFPSLRRGGVFCR